VYVLCYVILNCPVLLYFPHYLIKGTIFQNKLLDTKCEFWVSLHLLETFLILRRNDRDMINNVYWRSCKVPFILVRFSWKLKISRHIFEKYSNVKFHENLSSWSIVVPCGQTDRQTDRPDEAYNLRHFPKAPKNVWTCKITELLSFDYKYTRDVVSVQWQVQYELIDLSSCWKLQPML
jgi:hypothetical protein